MALIVVATVGFSEQSLFEQSTKVHDEVIAQRLASRSRNGLLSHLELEPNKINKSCRTYAHYRLSSSFHNFLCRILLILSQHFSLCYDNEIYKNFEDIHGAATNMQDRQRFGALL
jgi:hypothetical protein